MCIEPQMILSSPLKRKTAFYVNSSLTPDSVPVAGNWGFTGGQG